MYNKVIDIYKYLSEIDPKCADSIYYKLELFTNSFDDGLAILTTKIREASINGDFDKIDEVNSYCKKIKALQSELNECLDKIVCRQQDEEELIEQDEDEDEKKHGKAIDYSNYVVDSDKRHTLDEDYEHKKICGFMLEGIRYNAENWQDALVSLCSLLAKGNKHTFDSYIDKKEFKGRKISYFGKTYIPKKNKQITGTNIYVWINLSANMIKKFMRKILVAFGIKPSTFFVFLRADYTPLHMCGTDVDVDNESDDLEQEKIGAYVKKLLRELAASKYRFSDMALKDLQDKEKSKEIVGVNYPLLKKVNDMEEISAQTKNTDGQARYWKEIFVFNDVEFLVTSQWYKQDRKNFDVWYNSLKG